MILDLPSPEGYKAEITKECLGLPGSCPAGCGEHAARTFGHPPRRLVGR
jgi:hypothetical protein